jgi:hypothetical protein
VVQQPDSGENACSDDTESTHSHHLSSSSSKVSEEVEVVGRKHVVVDDVGTEEGGVGCTNSVLFEHVCTAGGIEDGAVERRWSSGGGAGHWRPRPRLEASKRAATQGEQAGGGASRASGRRRKSSKRAGAQPRRAGCRGRG